MFSYPTPFTPPTTEEDDLAWLRLIRSRKVGPATFHRLIAEHGTASAALAALPEMARTAGIADYTPCPEAVALAEIRGARKAGAQMIRHGTPLYPPLLAGQSDAPPVLWALGDAALLARPMLAVVGARSASSLGVRMARRLAEDLSAAGFVIVSGLARGIDAAAHAAALDRGTVAVMAGGVDTIYPAENAALAADIARKGLRLSEQPPGLEPQARHFPQRNRIVAGLPRAVIVVEAAGQSGSLITARMALDLGREVMAVPGHPFDGRAAGCNALIRDGATLVRGAGDVIAALGHAPAPAVLPGTDPTPAEKPRRAGLPDRTVAARAVAAPDWSLPAATGASLPAAILDRLGPAPLAEDQLIRDLGLDAGRIAPDLLALELDGRIQRQPGGLLVRMT